MQVLWRRYWVPFLPRKKCFLFFSCMAIRLLRPKVNRITNTWYSEVLPVFFPYNVLSASNSHNYPLLTDKSNSNNTILHLIISSPTYCPARDSMRINGRSSDKQFELFGKVLPARSLAVVKCHLSPKDLKASQKAQLINPLKNCCDVNSWTLVSPFKR